MKRLFTKSISSALLCMLLTVLMLFSGCNSGSSATNIFESMKEASEVQKYDFEMDLEIESNNQTLTMEVDGTYNNEESMMASANITMGAMSLKIGEIILDGDRIYIDLSDLLSTFGSTDVLNGKEYIYIDMSELQSLAEMSGTEMPDMEDLSASKELSDLVTDKIYEILEKAADGVEPAVLGQDGSKFTFTVNKENVIDYIRNVVNVVADEQDWIVSTLPEALENAGLSDLADMIYDNESEIIDALESTVESVAEDPTDPLSDDEDFEILAYSEMTNDGGRIWNIGIEITAVTSASDDLDKNLSDLESGLYSLAGNSTTISLDTIITENSADKEITEVDEDNAISYMELMMSSMSSMYGSDDSTEDLYSDDLYSSLI